MVVFTVQCCNDESPENYYILKLYGVQLKKTIQRDARLLYLVAGSVPPAPGGQLPRHPPRPHPPRHQQQVQL